MLDFPSRRLLIVNGLIEFRDWRFGCLYSRCVRKILLGESMGAKFDIFKKLPDGHPLWVKAVDGIEEARAQLARLAANSPDEYFIYSVHDGCVMHAKAGSGGRIQTPALLKIITQSTPSEI